MSIYKICKYSLIALIVFILSFLTTLLLNNNEYYGFMRYSAGINAVFISFFSFTSLHIVNYLEKIKGWS